MLAVAPPVPVATSPAFAALLSTKWVRWIVAVPPMVLACRPPPSICSDAASEVARDRRVGDSELIRGLYEEVDARRAACAATSIELAVLLGEMVLVSMMMRLPRTYDAAACPALAVLLSTVTPVNVTVPPPFESP